VSETPIVSAPGGIRAIMGQAIALYRARFVLYLGLIAIPVVPVGIAMVVLAAVAPDPGKVMNQITGIDIAAEFLLVMPLAQGAVAYAAAAQIAGRKVTLPQVLRAVLPRFSVLVGTVILSSLLMAVGLIVFVIPGLVMAIWFQFVGQVVILENLTFAAALRRCRDLVRGNWWRTLRYVLVIGIVEGIAGVLAAALFGGVAIPQDASDRARLVLPLAADIPSSILVLPFSTIALTIVYLRLRRERPAA
jgi:hypothetical protein